MSRDVSFEAFVGRLRAGDPDAAAHVFHRFAQRLIGLVAARLNDLLRPQAEPEDVVQSIFRSFFTRQRANPFRLGGWDDLWALLVVITLRKCSNQGVYHRAARRDVRREVTLPPAALEPGAGWDAVAREPDPAEAVHLAETVERLLRPFPERERAVVELSLQGYTAAEISVHLGCSERKVYRVLERVRMELRRMRSEAA